MQPITLNPIGVVQNEAFEAVDESWGKVVSRITLLPEFRGGLLGLEQFTHVIILTWLHGACFEAGRHLQRRPRGQQQMPLLGIFSQRAKDRPNPIGLTAVKIRAVGDDYLEVEGLDAIHGTPVLDIKPYFPVYDRVENAGTPEWVDELMQNYF